MTPLDIVVSAIVVLAIIAVPVVLKWPHSKKGSA